MEQTVTTHRTSVLIRDAVLTDAEALSVFAARLFRETYRPTAASADIEAHIARHLRPDVQAKEIEQAHSRTLLAEIAGELAGYAQLQRGPAPPCLAGTDHGHGAAVEIRRFYVAPRWHGQGVAQQLMAASLATREQDLPVWLGVFAHNARAIAFYAKCGFRIAGDTTFYMGDTPERDHVMVWGADASRPRESRPSESRK